MKKILGFAAVFLFAVGLSALFITVGGEPRIIPLEGYFRYDNGVFYKTPGKIENALYKQTGDYGHLQNSVYSPVKLNVVPNAVKIVTVQADIESFSLYLQVQIMNYKGKLELFCADRANSGVKIEPVLKGSTKALIQISNNIYMLDYGEKTISKLMDGDYPGNKIEKIAVPGIDVAYKSTIWAELLAVSPDGTKFLFSTNRNGFDECWVKDLITGEEKVVGSNLKFICWHEGRAYFSKDYEKTVVSIDLNGPAEYSVTEVLDHADGWIIDPQGKGTVRYAVKTADGELKLRDMARGSEHTFKLAERPEWQLMKWAVSEKGRNASFVYFNDAEKLTRIFFVRNFTETDQDTDTLDIKTDITNIDFVGDYTLLANSGTASSLIIKF